MGSFADRLELAGHDDVWAHDGVQTIGLLSDLRLLIVPSQAKLDTKTGKEPTPRLSQPVPTPKYLQLS
jgi:hypothetical protein